MAWRRQAADLRDRFGLAGSAGGAAGRLRPSRQTISSDTLGVSFDRRREPCLSSKGSVGVHFLIEPRFLPNLNVTRRTGIEVPPPGVNGLE